jgi:hypothetical protein
MSAAAAPSKTHPRYQEVYDRLRDWAFSAELRGNDDEGEYGGVVEALLAKRADWTPSTERSIKAAVLHVLEAHIQSGSMPAYCATRRLAGMLAPHRDPMGHFGSQEEKDAAVAREQEFRRQRTIRLQSQARDTPHARATRHRMLLLALQESRSKWAADTLRWYTAAVLTGLAPAAWKCATWVDCGRGRVALCLGESARPDRIASFVSLDQLTSNQLATIRAHLETVDAKVQAGAFEAWYDACRRLLRTEASSLWPGQESLPTLHPAERHSAARWMSN